MSDLERIKELEATIENLTKLNNEYLSTMNEKSKSSDFWKKYATDWKQSALSRDEEIAALKADNERLKLQKEESIKTSSALIDRLMAGRDVEAMVLYKKLETYKSEEET